MKLHKTPNKIRKTRKAPGSKTQHYTTRPEFLRLVDWTSTFKIEREPKRQEDLATELGVSRETLWAWKQVPEFTIAMRESLRKKAEEIGIHSIHGWVRRIASEGNAADVRLLLEYAFDFTSKSKQIVENEAEREIAESLKKLANRK